MIVGLQDDTPLGVYHTDVNGTHRLVHQYMDGDYDLEDIFRYFQLGTLESTRSEIATIRLSKNELRELRVMADARSFDFEEGFIEMCLDIQRFSEDTNATAMAFFANF